MNIFSVLDKSKNDAFISGILFFNFNVEIYFFIDWLLIYNFQININTNNHKMMTYSCIHTQKWINWILNNENATTHAHRNHDNKYNNHHLNFSQ